MNNAKQVSISQSLKLGKKVPTGQRGRGHSTPGVGGGKKGGLSETPGVSFQLGHSFKCNEDLWNLLVCLNKKILIYLFIKSSKSSQRVPVCVKTH